MRWEALPAWLARVEAAVVALAARRGAQLEAMLAAGQPTMEAAGATGLLGSEARPANPVQIHIVITWGAVTKVGVGTPSRGERFV